MPRNASCQRCILHAATRHVCLWGSGPHDAKIMLVGEAPGGEEENTGRPFVGQAGRLLDSLIKDVGLRRSDIYVTNATKCRPPGNRTPEPAEAAACLPYFAEEVETVKPKVIVCVGGSALKAVTGLGAIGPNRGRVLGSAKLRTEAKVIVTYHPAAALHNPKERERTFAAIREDLRLAVSLSGEEVAGNADEARALVYAGQYAELINALISIAEAKVLVADCEWIASHETDDLIWPWDTRSHFLSLSFSARLADGLIHTVAVQWDEAFRRPLTEFMRKRHFVFHNAMADLIWLLYLGFTVPLRGDTLVLAYLMDEQQRLALDQLAPLIAGVRPGWKKPLWRQPPANKSEAKKLLDYNCFPGMVSVRAPSGVFGGSKRAYSGPMIEIATDRGYKLSGTPNHPILTDRGWIPLGELEVGDNVISRSRRQNRVHAADDDIEDADAPIGEVFSLLQATSVAKRVQGSKSQFHGDGQDSEVDVIATDGLLQLRRETPFHKPSLHENLSLPDQLERVLASQRSFSQTSFARRSSAQRVLGFGNSCERPSSLLRIGEPHGRCLSERPDSYPLFPQNLDQDSGIPPTVFSDRGGTLSDNVTPDRVIEINRFPWSGHVYNLRTSDHMYFANDIVASNCDDTYATLRLYEALQRRIAALDKAERSNILRCYGNLLLPALPTFVRMAIAGVGTDTAALTKVIAERHAELDTAERTIAETAAVPLRTARAIAGSPQQTSTFIRANYALEIEGSTKQELGRYADDYPLIGQIRTFRHERKLLGTYLEPWQRLISKQRDGRIHSVYRLTNSRTGRTSAELSEGGSLQLAPREEWLRRLIAARRGRKIVAADYSQIELRVISWLAPESTMRQLFVDGADLHTTTAAAIARIAEAEVTKEQRQRAKGVNFGFCYGMQAENFVDYALNNYGVRFTYEEADRARRDYFKLYPELQAWHDRATNVDFERQQTVTPTGRYRRSFKSPTEAINTPIQTTASDLTVFAMQQIEEQLIATGLLDPAQVLESDAFLTGFVHDSVLVECREDMAEEVAALVKETMEHPDLDRIGIHELPVPLVADVKVGQSWGDAS